MSTDRAFQWMAILAVVGGLSFLLYITYLMHWPFKVVEVEQPYKLHEKVLTPGSWATWTTDYCRYTDVESTIKHQLVCENGISSLSRVVLILEDRGLQIDEGCGSFTKRVFIPKTVNPAQCFIEIDAFYPINPLRTIRVPLRTESFTIVGER